MRRTLGVLGLLTALVGGALWLDRGRPDSDEARQARGTLAPGFDATGAQHVEVRRSDGTVRLARQGAAWWIESPRGRADEGRVQSLLGALEGARIERRIAHPDAALRRTLGVDAPRVTLIVDGRVLHLGADDAAGRNVYVTRGDDPEVLLVDRYLFEASDRAPDAWRSLRLCVDGPPDAAIAYGDWALERAAGQGWRVVRPFGARAAADRVDALVAALERASARRSADGNFGPVDGGAPRPGVGRVDGGAALRLDGREVARIGGACAGHPDERMVLRADGAALCFAAAELAPLELAADSLREPRLVPFTVDAVRAVEVSIGGRALKLERSGGAWRIVAPLDGAGPADDAAVHEWLTELGALHAQSWVAPGRAVGALRIATSDDTIEAALGDGGGGALTVTRRGEREALLLPGAGAALSAIAPLRFHPRRIASFSPDAVERVTVEERGVTVELARDPATPGTFHRVRPPDGSAGEGAGAIDPRADQDAGAIGPLIEAVSSLRAERFVADAAGFRPTRRIALHLRDDTTHALELDGACRARERSDAPLFALAPAACAALRAPLP